MTQDMLTNYREKRVNTAGVGSPNSPRENTGLNENYSATGEIEFI
jgi:hypothetical protein